MKLSIPKITEDASCKYFFMGWKMMLLGLAISYPRATINIGWILVCIGVLWPTKKA